MTEEFGRDSEWPVTTDGEIAVVNLESARRRSWSRLFADPRRDAVAETVVEHEQLTAQFIGDVRSLDRLEGLVEELAKVDPMSARTALIQAHVASMTHRFTDARRFLGRAEAAGAPASGVNRLRLTIDQACGADLGKVLDERRAAAGKSDRTEDLVTLGALLADLGEFTDADRVYREALRGYRDVSPFPAAWVYFQLGVLWGELVPEPQMAEAAGWYRKAVDCLPGYTKARVHLAEVHSASGRSDVAEALLIPALTSGDPEVPWRLADALTGQKRYAEAEVHMEAARFGFETLLERHLLAFADHGAEFYAGSGNDLGRALGLARRNVANRPTLRAFQQAHAIALNAGDTKSASELFAEATMRWSSVPAFRSSRFAMRSSKQQEGVAV
jgi:tetratricopeptide (TPR) repeat protein